MNMLALVKIEAIKNGLSMTEIIRISGVSRDTFYKKLKKNDIVFYKELLIKIKSV